MPQFLRQAGGDHGDHVVAVSGLEIAAGSQRNAQRLEVSRTDKS
jgi:hypothetical protein